MFTLRLRCKFPECEFHAESQEELDQHHIEAYHCPKCGSPFRGEHTYTIYNPADYCAWCLFDLEDQYAKRKKDAKPSDCD